MPRINNPASPIVGKLEGLHLFHFDGAPCAQRVRFALAEKGLVRGREVKFAAADADSCRGEEGAWVSRIVSLIKREHLSPTYAKIQPNLVVPALVHDGVLYTESMDIIEYIDNTFGGEPLIPIDNPRQLKDMQDLVTLGKQLHRSVRFVTFRWGLRSLGKLSNKEEHELKLLLKNHKDEEKLIDFYQDYDKNTIPDSVYFQHLRQLMTAFQNLDRQLNDGRAFLTGSTVTMADALWAMKLVRLIECGYPLAQCHPALYAWHQRIIARPSFQSGVMQKHKLMHNMFRFKAGIENIFGAGLAGVVLQKAEQWKLA